MAGFDVNVWYSVAYTASVSGYNLGVDPNNSLSVYLYPNNITDKHQQFQILTAPSSTSQLPTYLFRGFNATADSYLMVYCAALSNCLLRTWGGMYVVGNPEDVVSNLEWTLADAGAEDGPYHVMNQVNGTAFHLDSGGDSPNTIWMNSDLGISEARWTILSVSAIDDTHFSRTATPLAPSTTSITVMTAATTNSPLLSTSSLSAPTVTSTTSSVSSKGMSSSTKAEIGGGVAGGLFLLFLVLAALAFCMRRGHKLKPATATNDSISPNLFGIPFPDFDTRRPKEMQGESSGRSNGRARLGQRWERRAELNAEPRSSSDWSRRVQMETQDFNALRMEVQQKQNRQPVELAP